MRLSKIILSLVICLVSLNLMAEEPLQIHDANGNSVQLSTFKGKWIILNFWAEWCDSCVREIPELNNFYLHNQNKNVVLYGVNFDQLPLPELKNTLTKMKITYPELVENPATAWSLAQIDVLPVTFIIAPNGKVAKTILGPNTEQSLLDALKDLQRLA
ncbi:MAG: TlpA disulfide reductase family protein [Gammaproteobacteria bacterium]